VSFLPYDQSFASYYRKTRFQAEFTHAFGVVSKRCTFSLLFVLLGRSLGRPRHRWEGRKKLRELRACEDGNWAKQAQCNIRRWAVVMMMMMINCRFR
jgi:hypothetical protein